MSTNGIPAGGSPRDARAASPEHDRLAAESGREANWKRWGPYLSERQWGTVREDYSSGGDCWNYFPHDHARSRAYRWGEDGLLGFTDRQCRICLALALWNGVDPILKERLFGLNGNEGNHGEDVKEVYHYLDATPTASYAVGMYRYPLAPFPYETLVRGNAGRSRLEPELELTDTGVFDGENYVDAEVTWAKAAPEDLLWRIAVKNRSARPATVWVLPHAWFRNTWSWGCGHEGCGIRPHLRAEEGGLRLTYPDFGDYRLLWEAEAGDQLLVTGNETNQQRLFGVDNSSPWVKDAFHRYLIHGERDAVNARQRGTKAALCRKVTIPPRGEVVLRLRLLPAADPVPRFGKDFERMVGQRRAEADAFYDGLLEPRLTPEERLVCRQANAGLIWSKQFYHLVVRDWQVGDSDQPRPPAGRERVRNEDWKHLYARDVISMPDKWEYPWFAAWDLAFHMIPMARLDPDFAKRQLLLLLREWYMHPSGQIPAYEFNFSDVNPPVHAWACWRVYKMSAPRGHRDLDFLKQCFHKLLLNFTWWVNRKDPQGRHLFAGGFLGLDNIGIFDRSKPLPGGGSLVQADGTAWMAFYCGTMLHIAIELADHDRSYEGIASKFFEHFVAIIAAINQPGGCGLWDEEDGFYYDRLLLDGQSIPLKSRSLVGVIPLLATEVVTAGSLSHLTEFTRRVRWFLDHDPELAKHVHFQADPASATGGAWLLAVADRARLERSLRYLLDETEFLSPHGIRSLSRIHCEHPYRLHLAGETHEVRYTPGDSDTGLFGGNSNWRGPVWFPINYLLLEALERYQLFFGDTLQVECPRGSGRMLDLEGVVGELHRRLSSLFLPDAQGRRPCNGDDPRWQGEHWRDLVWFHEYFHGDNGRGCGANHQTGWTALAVHSFANLARGRK